MHFKVLVVGTQFGWEEVGELLFPYWSYDFAYPVEKMRTDPRFVFEPVDLKKAFEEEKLMNLRHKEKYESYESMEDWAENNPYLSYEEGLGWGTWCNPQSKGREWDGFSIGGRWTGFFLLKEGAEGLLGTQGIFTEGPNDTRAADQARKCDIAWEAMVKREREWAEQYWDEAMKASEKERRDYVLIRSDDTKRSFVNRYEKWACLPSAVLMDGEWHEGTLAKEERKEYQRVCDRRDHEKNQEKWEADMEKFSNGEWLRENEKKWPAWEDEFQELFEQIPDDAVLTLVDCHI
jgi:hypothetical protein